MKGVLTLLFLCVAVQLTNGHHPLNDREDTESSIITERKAGSGGRGPVTTFVRALWETAMIVFDGGVLVPSRADFANFSTRPRVLTLHDLRDSKDAAVSLAGSYKPSDTDKCFIRELIDTLNLLLGVAYDEDDESHRLLPGPEILYKLSTDPVIRLELSSERNSAADKAILQSVKLIRRVLKDLRGDLVPQLNQWPQIFDVLDLSSHLELFFDDFIEAVRILNVRGTASPAIHLLLDYGHDLLGELLNEIYEPAPSTNSGRPTSSLRRFGVDVKQILRPLMEENFKTKGNPGNMSALRRILISLKSTLGRIIADKEFFTKIPGSGDEFLLHVITWIEAGLAAFV